MDLIVRNVRLAEGPSPEPVDIGVAGGKIVAVAPRLVGAKETYDAGGRLACAGLIETHIHLDKSRIIDRCPPETGREISPMRQVAAMKPGFTVEDVRLRAERTLVDCILNGTTRMRTQVEVDPAIGMRGLEAVQSLIADYKWAIDIEICVFPQDGLTSYPGTDELLVEGLERGARAIGGAPRYDADPDGQIRRIFDLAREYDVDIDIHLDVGNTPEAMNIGVAVTVLPATDLYLMGRDQDHNVRRGVADANFLVERGVNCSLSTNNVLNPATPYGDCSLIRMANLHANVLQIAGPVQLRECFAMLTERSARLLNLTDYGLAVGNPADIVVIDATTPEQTIAEIRQPLAVFKRGRRTVVRHPAELVRPQ
jgi:cytosine deaminase